MPKSDLSLFLHKESGDPFYVEDYEWLRDILLGADVHPFGSENWRKSLREKARELFHMRAEK